MDKKIIFVHGYTASSQADWYPNIKPELDKLGVDYSIPDLPGGECLHSEDWVKIIKRKVEATSKPVVLVGHSLGTRAILLYLDIHQRKVNTVILIAPLSNEVKNAKRRGGETYQAEINQFHGVVKKEKVASKSSVAGQVTAGGRMLPCPDYDSKGPCKSDLEYLERMAAQAEGDYIADVHVEENANSLEMTFPQQGGEVSGSFVWEFNIVVRSKGFAGAGEAMPNINHWDGNFTGKYSGGKKGNFKGDLDGVISFSSGDNASFTGTWTAEMKADGMIEGTFHYIIAHSLGGRVEDQLAFRATVE